MLVEFADRQPRRTLQCGCKRACSVWLSTSPISPNPLNWLLLECGFDVYSTVQSFGSQDESVAHIFFHAQATKGKNQVGRCDVLCANGFGSWILISQRVANRIWRRQIARVAVLTLAVVRRRETVALLFSDPAVIASMYLVCGLFAARVAGTKSQPLKSSAHAGERRTMGLARKCGNKSSHLHT